MEKITTEEILELLPKCEKYYDKLHTESFANDEKLYELDFKDELRMPKEFAADGIVLPTARDMADTFVDHIDIQNARVFVNKQGTSRMDAEASEMMRKFYLGLIYRTNTECDISPWRVAAKHYALHGLGTFKTVWDADRWADKPERGDESEESYASKIDTWRADTHESLPIVIQAINPSCVYPDPSYGGRQFVFEVQERTCFDISEKWPNWKNSKGKKISDSVKYVEYWDKKFRSVLIDGEPVLKIPGGVVEHKYGFIPYVFIDTGLGNMSLDADPVKRYVGILRYIYDLLIAESRDFSIADTVLKHTAWPWGTIKGKDAGSVGKIDQQFGTYTPLPDGVEIVNMTPQVPPDALTQHLFRTASYISSHAAPNSVRGLPEQGVRSGADRRLMIAEAASRYQYATEAFKNGTAKVLTNCARLMKNVIPYNFNVWTRTPTDEFDIEIDKEKMKEPFTCYVEFSPISEEDEYRRHDDAERLVAAGIVTRSWARKQMSNVDPIAMEREEEKERIKQDPAIQQAMSQYIAGKMAEQLAKRSAAESIKNPPPPVNQMQPTEPGRQMIPPIPNRAPLGSGQDLQNQMAQNRSQIPMSPTQGRGINAGGNKP
jgi:hypothetical protein